MKKTILSLMAAAVLAAPAIPAAADEPARLVTVLTAPEPQTQLMAMVLTMQSISQGAKAQILLCGPAADIALDAAPESATAPQPPKGMSPQGLMKAIMETGAKVEVCAIYLPGKGIGPDALIDGVTPAKPDAMAAALLAENVRILSF